MTAPILRWCGGKRRQAGRILELLGDTGPYLEPFAGSAAVGLVVGSTGAPVTLVDAIPRLVGMHRAIRDDPDAVHRRLRELGTDQWAERYYQVRQAYNDGPRDGSACARQAARLIWLNRCGFNGMYRENRAGGFNVPVGRHTTVRLPSRRELHAASQALAGARITYGTALREIEQAGAGWRIYADPPYLGGWTGYGGRKWTQADLRELLSALEAASRRGARVVVSHSHTVTTLQAFADRPWALHTVHERRSVGRSGASRGSVRELLAVGV